MAADDSSVGQPAKRTRYSRVQEAPPMLIPLLVAAVISAQQQPPPRPVIAPPRQRTTVVRDSTAPDTTKGSNAGRRSPVTADRTATAIKDQATRDLFEKARRAR